jgi:hypothetical protein
VPRIVIVILMYFRYKPIVLNLVRLGVWVGAFYDEDDELQVCTRENKYYICYTYFFSSLLCVYYLFA